MPGRLQILSARGALIIDQQADYLFHPVVEEWFRTTFTGASDCQRQAWPAVQSGADTLIAAPTGSGKTLAAFLSAIDALVRRSLAGGLEDRTYVVYVSPLKALSNDIQRNLDTPLQAIDALLEERGLAPHGIRTAVRTGDTPQAARAAMRRRPPHILVTTPESLYILLTSDSGRVLLKGAGTVIVDEIHAVVGSKRGAHLALTLARLDALSGRPAGPWDRAGRAQRIGLSATQRPIEMVAGFLTGADAAGAPRPCRVIDSGHMRQWDIAVEMPASPLEAVASADQAAEMYDRLAELIDRHATTLVFVNTRRLAERLARALTERLGEAHITSHHGSMSRDKRLSAERRLKNGELKALVATASLELGIDIGDVDLVCQIGATRTLATLLQRVGRSGHGIGRIPRGRLFPQTRDDLVTCAALLDMSRRGELDSLIMPEAPLDVLAQQVVAETACEESDEDSVYALCRGAYPYRALSRDDFDAVMQSLGEGYSTALGRRGAWVHRDRVNGRIAARRGARLSAITCGGAIPDNADYDVIAEPDGQLVGTVTEDFAIESIPGNIFQLGNTSWRVLRVEALSLRVADAAGEPPNIPFWIGEAPARSEELSLAVSRLRGAFTRRVEAGAGSQDTMLWLVDQIGLNGIAAQQLDSYLRTARAALGTLPTQDTLVLERFFDESGAMQLVIHAPFGSRINRGFGLALRKRFCRSFNFELQAAATDDAIVISLGPVHSFPLADVWRFLDRQSVRDVLTQALLDAPMFPVRWRWNASCALAILRFRGGSRVAPRLQRMNADDLLALVFPDQLACAENLTGRREVPDHPLVAQTIHDCLTEAMDIDGLETLVDDIRNDRKRLVECDLTEPSPLAMEVLNANPYAFLDDAPLEERRTHAVRARRWLDVETASELGQLDGRAIERVRDEVWPAPRNEDEMHDALITAGFLLATEITGRAAADGWHALFDSLVGAGRATVVSLADGAPTIMVAAERLAEVQSALAVQAVEPALNLPEPLQTAAPDAAAALIELLRSRLEISGPQSAAALRALCGATDGAVAAALARLENEGTILQGRYTPGTADTEWCHRRLLARIHRYTIDRLRSEIEPVSSAEYLRFLLGWSGVSERERRRGQAALGDVIEQLSGFEAAVSAWEGELLPARLADYQPGYLDAGCLAGEWTWLRLRTRDAETARPGGPVKATPIAILPRADLGLWLSAVRGDRDEPGVSARALPVLQDIDAHGASFFSDLEARLPGMRHELEAALGELVAAGLVHADGFAGLRSLLSPAPQVPSRRRRPGLDRGVARAPSGAAGRAGRSRRTHSAPLAGGRWARLPVPAAPDDPETVHEDIAWRLLHRYGIVFRRVLERESSLPPWREILWALRRLEMRGEVRGGRFVAGYSGEQFALADAVAALRALKRQPAIGELTRISASDPLNLSGILTPGLRIPAVAHNKLVLRDGLPVAVKLGDEIRLLAALDGETEMRVRTMLVPPLLAGSGRRRLRAR